MTSEIMRRCGRSLISYCIFTVRNIVAASLFSRASVILFTGGCVWQTPPCRHTPWADPPPPDGYCSGRYASYWSAFLLINNSQWLADYRLQVARISEDRSLRKNQLKEENHEREFTHRSLFHKLPQEHFRVAWRMLETQLIIHHIWWLGFPKK